MKLISITITVLTIVLIVQLFYLFQSKDGGKVIRINIEAIALKGNIMNEPSQRFISIYLPKGYENSAIEYPTVYFLHGFRGSDELFNSDFKKELDEAIEKKLIPPLIFIAPNSSTKFGGSFYTNSDIAGKWADYIALDVVKYIDENYRTIKNRNSRIISGHSMGGNGALKIAMLFPSVFGSVYALSPSILYWSEELISTHEAFIKISEAKNFKEIESDLYAAGFLAMGSTYSPKLNYPPFYCQMPFSKINNKMVIDSSVYNIWEAQFPLQMIKYNIASLKSLNGIGFDWGNNDEFKHLPVTCKLLDKELSKFGILHSAKEYEGKHSDKLTGKESRMMNGLIPFIKENIK